MGLLARYKLNEAKTFNETTGAISDGINFPRQSRTYVFSGIPTAIHGDVWLELDSLDLEQSIDIEVNGNLFVDAINGTDNVRETKTWQVTAGFLSSKENKIRIFHNGGSADWGTIYEVRLYSNSVYIEDSSGNDNHATPTALTYGTGKFEGSAIFNGTTSYIITNSVTKYLESKSFSVSMWIKCASQDHKMVLGINTLGGGNRALFGVRAAGMGFYDNAAWHIGSINVGTSKWTNVIYTYDRNSRNLKTYIDGVLDLDVTSADVSIIASDTFAIGMEYDSATPSDFYNGEIEDFRVYNHVISEKEAGNLAAAKILHYDFDDKKYESTTNVCDLYGHSQWNNSGTATWNYDDPVLDKPIKQQPAMSILKGTVGSSALLVGYGTTTPSKIYTVSTYFWMDWDGAGSTPYMRQYPSNTSAGTLKWVGNDSTNWSTWPQKRWIRLYGTFTSATDATYVAISSYINNPGTKFIFNGWQVEQKDHLTTYTSSTRNSILKDKSPYGRDSDAYTVSQSPKIEESPIGRYYAKFDGTATKYIRSASTTFEATNWSISAWLKKDAHSVSSYPIFWSFGLPYMACNGSSSPFRLSYSNPSQDNVSGTTIPVLGQWYHVVATSSSDGCRIYVDGELEGTNSNLSTNTGGDIEIGRHSGSDTYRIDGGVADLRIFRKALSLDEIKKLYKENSNKIIKKNSNSGVILLDNTKIGKLKLNIKK